MIENELKSILENFQVELNKVSFQSINQGYINDTILVKIDVESKYILQRINSTIFKNVEALHKNLNQALKQLTDRNYTQISLISTKNNRSFYEIDGQYWRLMSFVQNSIAYNHISDKNIVFEAGRLLGKFHTSLNNESVETYENTLKYLNYLPFRISEFDEALKNTLQDKKQFAQPQIQFAKNNKDFFDLFYESNLPLRVCHNDTKLNNLLFDSNSGKGLCFIDLDTIMPGYFHYDFGDLIRTVVSESNEDEQNLKKIGFNITLFESFVQGLKPYAHILTKKEIEFLPIACALMPFMHGIRALTDYLNGNVHYKVSYENQNLDRCNSLFEFTRLALINQDNITKIITEQFNNHSK